MPKYVILIYDNMSVFKVRCFKLWMDMSVQVHKGV